MVDRSADNKSGRSKRINTKIGKHVSKDLDGVHELKQPHKPMSDHSNHKSKTDAKTEKMQSKFRAGFLRNAKGKFKTLLSLFETAKITTLKSSGNYTIFAPTDEAFSKSKLNLEDLKKPEHADQLRSLLH